ncbi:MAG: hypothetical protein ABIO70_31265 [Pseudomonadota bacterium]
MQPRFLVALLMACGCAPPQPGDTDSPPPVEDTGDSADTGMPPGDEFEIVEVEGGAWPACERGCWEDYLDLGDRAPQCVVPHTHEELVAAMAAIDHREVDAYTTPVAPEKLQRRLMEILRLDCLEADLPARDLEVRVIERSTWEGFERLDLLFVDSYVGRFAGILLLPGGEGPFPAVVAIHGHGSWAEDYLTYFQGDLFPPQGVAILALDMRASEAGAVENDVSWSFLLDGFLFMGIRAYETRRALDYLRWRPDIDGERLGLIGHSGGASASNLTVRTDLELAAYVSDWSTEYWNEQCDPSTFECILDEMAPDLYPQHLRIADFSTSPVPVLEVAYEAATTTAGMEEILAFFAEHL